jgi:serine/threonine protein kinase
MNNNIFYGANAILLPYKKHSKYTGSTDKNTICKVAAYNKGEMLLLPKLMEDKDSKKYLIEILSVVSYDTRMSRDIPKKTLDFIDYLVSIQDKEKPKVFTSKYNFSYLIFKNGGSDLYEIKNDISIGRKNHFTKDTEYKTQQMCRDLIDGLEFIHKKSICHFDIKPENIVFDTETERFKYIDFGMAEEFPFKRYLKNGPRGTLEYIPFSTTNFSLLSHFSALLPYIPCDDWSKGPDGKWVHIHYRNDPSRNTSHISSSLYKVDVYALGRTLKSVLDVICIYKDCIIDDSRFFNQMLEPKVFKRINLLEHKISIPYKIFNLLEEDYYNECSCCALS